MAYDYRDVLQASSLQLLDETFDERFSANLEERFGLFEGKRGETSREACCENDRVLRFERLQSSITYIGEAAGIFNEMPFREGSQGGVDRADGYARAIRQRSLSRLSFFLQGAEDEEFIAIEHEILLSCCSRPLYTNEALNKRGGVENPRNERLRLPVELH